MILHWKKKKIKKYFKSQLKKFSIKRRRGYFNNQTKIRSWRHFPDTVKRHHAVVFFVFLFSRNHVGVGRSLVLNVYKKIPLFSLKDRPCNRNEYTVRPDENILCWSCSIITSKTILHKGNAKPLKWFIAHRVLILSIKLDVSALKLIFAINF